MELLVDNGHGVVVGWDSSTLVEGNIDIPSLWMISMISMDHWKFHWTFRRITATIEAIRAQPKPQFDDIGWSYAGHKTWENNGIMGSKGCRYRMTMNDLWMKKNPNLMIMKYTLLVSFLFFTQNYVLYDSMVYWQARRIDTSWSTIHES
jgi:hypothetical protein